MLSWIRIDPKTPTLDELISDGSLIYDLGLDDYEFTTYRQHIIDLK